MSSMPITLLDLFVVGIIAICAFSAYKSGFARACLRLVPSVVSIVVAWQLYPFVSKFLRGTSLYGMFMSNLSKVIHMGGNMLQGQASQAIAGIDLPSPLKSALEANNTPAVYEILNVSKMEDYVLGFIANIGINILSLILVYSLISIVVRVFFAIIDVVTSLPGIRWCNKVLGAGAGVVQGTVIVWIAFLVLSFLYYQPSVAPIVAMLNKSTVAKWFYDNNLFLVMTLKIFA